MSSRNETLKIHKPHIILCEGADEYWFLIRLLNSNELADTPFFSESIQVIDFGGNEELHNQLSVLKLTPGFANVESLLIMRDAERNAEGAIKQISASLGKVNLPVPEGPGVWVSQGGKLKVGYLLFPDCNNIAKEGTLEDLCLSI